MRIATLLPLYSIFSFIPICFPNTYVYMFGWIEVVQGIALYSFLMLLCDLLTPNDQQRVFFFASLRIPGRTDKTKTTDGLMWLQVRHWYLLVHLHDQITNRAWYSKRGSLSYSILLLRSSLPSRNVSLKPSVSTAWKATTDTLLISGYEDN